MSLSPDPSSVDELGLARPRIQYKVDDPDGYVRASFNKIVDLHEHVFRAMNVTQFKFATRQAGDPLNFGGSGHIMGTTGWAIGGIRW